VASHAAGAAKVEWIRSIDGASVRDQDTEQRGVRFEISMGESDEEDEADLTDMGTGPSRPLELQLHGDQVVGGRITHRVWTWSVHDAVTGAKKESLDDAVRAIIMNEARVL
jgi:hypothetical protein